MSFAETLIVVPTRPHISKLLKQSMWKKWYWNHFF